jgi:nucleotide-binding universal stress UspA family protein
MYRRIIVPLDGSDLAESVLPHAIELAQRFQARIELLRAVTHMQQLMRESATGQATELGMDVARQRHDSEAESATHYLETTRARLVAQGIEDVRAEVTEGPAVAAILEAVRAAPAETLVVMATHGRGGLQRLALGSVADRLVQELRGVPVLLYRPE